MKLIYLDTETIDMPDKVDYDILCQLSYLVIDGDEFEIHDTYCKPENYLKSTTGTMSVTGITPELLEGKENINTTKAFNRLKELLLEPVTFVIHNKKFDIEVMKRVGIDLTTRPVICTYQIAQFMNDNMGFLFEQNKLSFLKYFYRLDLLRPEFDRVHGISSTGYHNSISDIADLALIYEKIKEVTKGTDEAFIELCSKPLLLKHIPFGKNKGELIEDLFENQVQYYKTLGNEHLDYTFEVMGW